MQLYLIHHYIPGLIQAPGRDEYNDLPWYQARQIECVGRPTPKTPESDITVLWKGPRRRHHPEARLDIAAHKAHNGSGDGVTGD